MDEWPDSPREVVDFLCLLMAVGHLGMSLMVWLMWD